MAELGVIASIIGIAGIGVKLSKTLYQVGHKTASASHNINRIATNVTLFSSMLKHVGTVFQDADSLHSPEAVETVEQIVRECESVFQEITKIVYMAKDKGESKEPVAANGKKRRLSVVQRAKWYFEQPRVECLMAQLEYLKTTLSVLIQTLNLAAVTQQVKEAQLPRETVEQEIGQEKLHVETLIVAQQLSVNVLQESQERFADALEEEPETPDSELSLESRYPKLLTQGSHASLEMVRLSDGNLEFLDRRPSQQQNEDSSQGAPLATSVSRSEEFIDELLNRWTRPQRPLKVPETLPEEAPARDERKLPVRGVPRAPIKERETVSSSSDHTREPTPDLKLQPVESPQPMSDLKSISRSTTPSKQWLDPAKGPPPKGPPRGGKKSPKPRATIDSAYSPPPPAYLGTMELDPESQSRKPSLVRTHSNPEGDGGPNLETFHDHHALVEYERPATPNISINIPQYGQYHPPPLYPPMPQARSPMTSGGTLTPYVPQNPHHYRQHYSNSRYDRYDPSKPSNYRAPYVSDQSTSGSESDSEDSTHGMRRPRRRSAQHQHTDSGFSDGLDIPWRIRIAPGKYFDFRDDALVGPRTPGLPTESKAWIYGQEGARTEISKKWVCEEAIAEKGYRYSELNEEALPGESLAGEEGAWRILQPLRFSEVDALVARTVASFRQRASASGGHSSGTGAPRRPYFRGAAAGSTPGSREGPNQGPGPALGTSPIPPHLQTGNRSVSYQDISGQHAPHGAWGLGPTPHGAPTYPPVGALAGQQPGPGQAPFIPALRRGAPDWWEGPAAPPRRHRDREYHDRERDLHRERDRDRDYYDRDYERSERGARSTRHRHKYRDGDGYYEKDGDAKGKEKGKKKGEWDGGDAGEDWGLAALLEGLDGAF